MSSAPRPGNPEVGRGDGNDGGVGRDGDLTTRGRFPDGDGVVRFHKAGVRWEAREEMVPVLPGLVGAPGTEVKASPAKVVTRHVVEGRTYFVKRYRHGAVAWRPAKYLFKASPARVEWRLARVLEERGVPIVRHLALGERWSWRGLEESLLVTEGFPGKPLDEPPGPDPALVLAFVGRLHDRGVLQRDLHPGNVLWNAATGEFRLVDVHGTELLAGVSEAQRRENVTFLGMFLPLPVDPAVADLSRRRRQPYLAYRSRRCLRHNREFAPEWHGGLRWWRRRLGPSGPVEAILADPDGFLASRARLLKRGRSSTVGAGGGLVLKRHNLRRASNLIKNLFRPSKARRAFQQAYHLELAGIPTARALAVAERRVLRFLIRSYFLMEEIPGAIDLGAWSGPRRQGAYAVAELLARLHEAGFSHRDLKETNLVFDADGRLHLIDLEGLRYVAEVTAERALADLSRLARARLPGVSAADRRAFVHRYCRRRGLRPRDLGIRPAAPGTAQTLGGCTPG